MRKITYLDLTTVNSGIILHGVNCQGVMGAGIARALVSKYPEIFPRYAALCATAKSPYHLLGSIDVVNITDKLTIVNCFTQNFYGTKDRPPASYSAIHECLVSVTKTVLVNMMLEDYWGKIYMPPIGCGLGGLEWTILDDILDYVENKYGVNFTVCDLPRK